MTGVQTCALPIFLDALTGVAYKDDSQVCSGRTGKRYDENDVEHAMVFVSISETPLNECHDATPPTASSEERKS